MQFETTVATTSEYLATIREDRAAITVCLFHDTRQRAYNCDVTRKRRLGSLFLAVESIETRLLNLVACKERKGPNRVISSQDDPKKDN